MRIKINPREVQLAKLRTKEFDKQKTYNKFVCKNNYIGYLGELVLDRWLTSEGIEHEWVPFIKQGTHSADFIIDGKTIDLKCSTSGDLWLTPYTPHDIYISACIPPDKQYMTINGWVPQSDIYKLKHSKNSSRQVTRGSRVAYVISTSYLLPIEYLGVLSSTPSVTNDTTADMIKSIAI